MKTGHHQTTAGSALQNTLSTGIQEPNQRIQTMHRIRLGNFETT